MLATTVLKETSREEGGLLTRDEEVVAKAMFAGAQTEQVVVER